MYFSLTVLGSNAAVPAAGRLTSAHLLNINEKYYLLDCGEGAQLQMRKYHIKTQRIRHVFITHLHGDHYYGLIGLLTTMHLLCRQKPLSIYSPPGLEDIITLQLKYSNTNLSYPVYFHNFSTEGNEIILDDDHVCVRTLPMKHSIPCCGFLFEEKQQSRSIKKEALGTYNIPVSSIASIKEGADYTDEHGNTVPNAKLTNDPPEPGRFAFCTDTAYNESLIPLIRGVDMLYHETTFAADMQERAGKTMHSTTADAARLAEKAQVAKLLAGHLSARYKDTAQLLSELRAIFPHSFIAEEGMEYLISDKKKGGG